MKQLHMNNCHIINGDYTGNDKSGTMTWEDPETGEQKQAWGEFNSDENGVHWHDVRDDNDNVMYYVTAQ